MSVAILMQNILLLDYCLLTRQRLGFGKNNLVFLINLINNFYKNSYTNCYNEIFIIISTICKAFIELIWMHI